MKNEALNSIYNGYKKNWIPALLGAIGGFLLVKKAFKSNSMLAIGAGIIVGSAIGSTISIKKAPKEGAITVTKP